MNFSFIYNINFAKLVADLLPIDWRQPAMLQWLEMLTTPLAVLHEDFLKYRKAKIYRLTHNSQVCYLQAVLNDAFDNTLRRIRIQNGRLLQPVYFYTPPEERPVYFETQYFYDPVDIASDSTDFVVCIPIDLQPNNSIALESYLSDARALINSYKLASKTYSIKWID